MWVKSSISYFLDKFNDVDNEMRMWMNDYNADLSNQSHKDSVLYLGNQKKNLQGIIKKHQDVLKQHQEFVLKLQK